jgi:hypothetical protein
VRFHRHDGDLAIALKFDLVGPFTEGLAQAQVDGKFGYIDTKGEWRIKPRYEGVIDMEGIIEKGDLVAYAALFKNGLAPVYLEGTSWGGGGTCQYIDEKVKNAFPAVFHYGGVFNEGLAPVQVDGKWGFIDISGNLVIDPQYSFPMGFPRLEFYLFPWNGFHNGLAPVALDGKVGYIDHDGTFVVSPQYSYGTGFFGGFALVYQGAPQVPVGIIDTTQVPVGIIDTTGRLIYQVSLPPSASTTTSP